MNLLKKHPKRSGVEYWFVQLIKHFAYFRSCLLKNDKFQTILRQTIPLETYNDVQNITDICWAQQALWFIDVYPILDVIILYRYDLLEKQYLEKLHSPGAIAPLTSYYTNGTFFLVGRNYSKEIDEVTRLRMLYFFNPYDYPNYWKVYLPPEYFEEINPYHTLAPLIYYSINHVKSNIFSLFGFKNQKIVHLFIDDTGTIVEEKILPTEVISIWYFCKLFDTAPFLLPLLVFPVDQYWFCIAQRMGEHGYVAPCRFYVIDPKKKVVLANLKLDIDFFFWKDHRCRPGQKAGIWISLTEKITSDWKIAPKGIGEWVYDY